MIQQLMDHKPIKKQTLRQNFIFLQEVWINMRFLRANTSQAFMLKVTVNIFWSLKNNVLVF